ncbi:hypothetical protein C0585_06230 [Candidatus Woesearchaeota archaeon]|nr:MAG: hypothetical protein C0585_06230 [Candidatus Woesearchaeota archaeon]
MAKKKIKHIPYKIKRKKSSAEIEKRNKIIMGLFISVIMVGSIMGIFVSQNNTVPELEYENENGEVFSFQVDQSSFYITEINDNYYNFYYHPSDLARFKNDTNEINAALSTNQAVILIDVNDINAQYIDLARLEISESFIKENIFIYGAKTTNSTSYPGLPVMNCDNATPELPFIYLRTGNNTNIELNNNCLIMEGNQYDFLRFKDLIVYTKYGVLP